MDEVMQPPSFDSVEDTGEVLEREAAILAAVRKIGLFAAGVASQRYMTALQDQQEVMADLADIITQVFALESSLLRARKLAAAGKNTAAVAAAMTSLLADESMALAEQSARRVLAACGEGDMLKTQLAILRRLARFTPMDSVQLSHAIAKQCVQLERYPLLSCATTGRLPRYSPRGPGWSAPGRRSPTSPSRRWRSRRSPYRSAQPADGGSRAPSLESYTRPPCASG